MKRLFLSLAMLTIAALNLYVSADDKPKTGAPESKTAPKNATKNEAVKKPAIQPAKPVQEKTPASPTGALPVAGVETGSSPDDASVRRMAAALVSSYNAHDAKAFSGAFTADGEYVDEKGTAFHGRKAIEAEFGDFFRANPATSIAVEVAATRTLAPAIIAADGRTRFTRARGETAISGHCHLICAREGEKWSVASLHEIADADARPSHHDQLEPLAWLIGEWIEEGPQSHVHFSCRWDEGGAFLIRDFSVQVGGQKTITGTQRIGYDPVTGHLKTWVFDSAGGYADGYVLRDGTKWLAHTSGVTSDGKMASGTNVFIPVDKHRMGWQAIDRIIGGEQVPDVEKVTVVKKPPLPAVPAK